MLTKILLIAVVASISLFGLSIMPTTALADSATSSTQSNDLTVPSVRGPDVASKLKSRLHGTWPWYITRAAGIVAVLLLVLLILSGIGLVSGYTFHFFEPLTAWAVHRAIGLSFGVAVAVHVIALLFDTYAPFSIAQVLLPFASSYRPATILGVHMGTLWVALGVFALYGLILIIVTSLLWVDKKPHTWKMFHVLSYLVAILIFFHGLYLGTDITHGIVRTVWIIFGIIIAVGILVRLRRTRSV